MSLLAEPAQGSRAFRVERVARFLASGILLGLSVANVMWAIGDWRPYDLTTYLDAARQWVETGSPYTPTARAEDWMLYRYAPWFAALFVPLLGLPHQIVEVGFSALMAAASVLAVIPMLRRYGIRGVPVAAFFGTMLLGIGAAGNVQPLMVALLVWTLQTRFGPAGIAIAASMKVMPILFVLAYAGRREWGKVAITLGLTAILMAPILLFELPTRAVSPGPSLSLIHISVVLWIAVGAAAVIAAAIQSVRGASTRWLAICAAVVLASPRLVGYDLTIFLASTPYDPRALPPGSASEVRLRPTPTGSAAMRNVRS